MRVIDQSNTSVTIYVAHPGLYLTYDSVGNLILTETQIERVAGNKRLVRLGERQLTFAGELGSDDYGTKPPPVVIDDDDVPF